MVCKQCGTEFYEGVFCPECGTKYSVESAASGQDINIKEEQNKQQDKERYAQDGFKYDNTVVQGTDMKVPWYLNMWFISLVYWFLSFLVVGFVAGIVLFTIRIVKYPEARKPAIISASIQIGSMVLIILLASLL